MKRSLNAKKSVASERSALGRRVKQFYAKFNEQDWNGCLSLIDPKLTSTSRVDPTAYAQRMQSFKNEYLNVKPWFTRLSLHLEASTKQSDKRPFAYVYVIWQDARHEFHMFRERWIKEGDHWFTRVVGLVPNKSDAVRDSGSI